MSKAAELAALIGSQSSLANRNMIINGNMAVHQRVATDTHNDSAVDRFALVKNGLDTADFTTKHQLITDNPPFSDALEIKCTTADTSIGAAELIRIRARLEANTLQRLQYGSASAKTSTLSFWVKSNLTDTFSVGLTSQDGTSQNIGFTYTIAQANTWQKVILNIPANTSATIDNDNGNGMMIVWGLSVGSNYRGTANTTWADFGQTRRLNGHTANIASSTSNSFYLTGVKWELGDVATAFEHESFGDNLAKCQRYFQLMNRDQLAGYQSGTTALYGTFFPTIEMRADPTSTYSLDYISTSQSGGAFANKTITGITTAKYGVHIEIIYAIGGGAGGSDNTPLVLFHNGTLSLDAEL